MRSCTVLGVQRRAEVARRGRLRWFWHVERIRMEMIGCRPVDMWWGRGEMYR